MFQPRFELRQKGTSQQDLCSNLTYDIVFDALSKSNGEKRSYFQLYRKLADTNLTSHPLNDLGYRVSSSLNDGGKSVLFVGDSIVREISETFKIVAPDVTVKLICSMLGYSRLNGLSNAQQDQEYLATLVLEETKKSPVGLIFVGGLANHHVRQDLKHFDMQGKDATANHKNLIETYLSLMMRLSQFLHVPIVFVGATPIDGWTFLMSPPKNDFRNFHETSNLAVWDSVESGIFSNERRWEGLHHLRPAGLVLQCPGIRCDGLHFGSDYSSDNNGWNCFNSHNIWQPYLVSFLLAQFNTAPP